jgi:tetratricopeptide (TPR) repeat protein
VNPHLTILLVGFFYILIFGGLSLLRREGLSNRFAFEVLGITALAFAGAVVTGTAINPILFLVLVYLISMRVRILVDLANLLASRGDYGRAISLLRLAPKLGPDKASLLIVLINQGVVLLRRGDPQEAQKLFLQVLEAAKEGGLGTKHEAACRYNLAVACNRLGQEAEAIRQFNEVAELMPTSIYSREAERAIKQRRENGLKRRQADQSPSQAPRQDDPPAGQP